MTYSNSSLCTAFFSVMDDVYWHGNENSREPYYQTTRVFLETKMFSCKKVKEDLQLLECCRIKVCNSLKKNYSGEMKIFYQGLRFHDTSDTYQPGGLNVVRITFNFRQ